MRPDEIILAVKEELSKFAEMEQGARARVRTATDEWNVLELLSSGPNGLLIVVSWAGDTNETEFPLVAICENTIEVIVGHNLGLSVDPGNALIHGTEDRPGLLELMWKVRQRVRHLTLDPDDSSTCFEYKGTSPVILPDGIPLAAYRARFTIEVSDDEPGEPVEWTEAE